MMIEGRVLKPKDKIYDLVDVLGAGDFFTTPAQGFPGMRTGREKIYDLVDVVEKKPRMALVDAGLRDEIMGFRDRGKNLPRYHPLCGRARHPRGDRKTEKGRMRKLQV
jgi:hypothetical protein